MLKLKKHLKQAIVQLHSRVFNLKYVFQFILEILW